MSKLFRITKGLDIPVKGKAALRTTTASSPDVLAYFPGDFPGIEPRLMVKEGDQILAGSPLFGDKKHPDLQIVASVSGKVLEIVRGEKRKLEQIRIQADPETDFLPFPTEDPQSMTKDAVRMRLMNTGLWALIRQRPYDCIANPAKTPSLILITGFDSAPLAPDYTYILRDQIQHLQTGIHALCKLTAGKVYLSMPANSKASFYDSLTSVEKISFQGPHPSGLASIQINRIAPVNKGDIVFTLSAPDLALIGKLFNEGKVNLQREIALCGPGIREPQYVRCVPGQNLAAVLHGLIHKEMNLRILSGNVLTGKKIPQDGSLPYQTYQITALGEGTGMHDFLGWAMPRFNLYSNSRTYFSWLVRKLMPLREFEPDTRILGGERAFIMSGEIEKVFPMDILPEYLLRACISGNIEKQENLGIYEIAPEDFALCEYVSTSKMPLQHIVREALIRLQKENGD